jgi:hypothetical protein
LRNALLNRATRTFLVALIAAVSAALPPGEPGALAHGGGTEIFRAREGAFLIVVWVEPERPVVGASHFTITPFNVETSAPVNDAAINIVANDPRGAPTYRVRALNAPSFRQQYEANITFETPGLWTLSGSVEQDALGRATVEVPLRVDELALGPSLAGTVAWLAVIGILVGGASYLWLKQRRVAARR